MGPSKHRASSAARRGNPFAGGILAVVFLFGLTASAGAQGAVRSVHWRTGRSAAIPHRGRRASMRPDPERGSGRPLNAGLTVIVLKTADQKSKLMRVVGPWALLLPSGLGLKLDNQDVGRAGFVRCLPNGCVAEVVMDDKLLGQLRTAKTATFIIFETPEEGIGFP